MIAFQITLAVWVLLELGLRLRDGLRRRPTQSRDAGTVYLLIATIAAGFLLGFWLTSVDALDLPGPDLVWLVAGLGIAWFGLFVRLWAVLTLGPFFTTRVAVQPGQSVVTRGPYRFVRHPSYLGLLLVLLGLGLATGNGGSAVVMVALPAAGLLRRIAVEETTLRSALGEQYVDYCHGRPRLIPGVW